MTGHNKKYVYGALIILGGIVVIMWMKNYLVDKGILTPDSALTKADPFGLGPLKFQPIQFTTTVNAQPGTTAFPSQLQ